MEVLWLTPDKPENISVGRRRIADHLERAGHGVTLRGTTAETAWRSLRERGRYDVVVGTTRSGAIAAVPIARVHSVPLVIDHVDPIRQLAKTHPMWLVLGVRLAETVAFRMAAHVLYVYDEEAPRIRRHAQIATHTALGVEFDQFADPPDERVERAHATLRERERDGPVLIYVGGLEPIYRVETLLKAMNHLDGWTLVCLGTGSLAERVRAAANEREDVIYPGTVPHGDVPGYLHAADVGICLVDDPYTLKILEYGAAGLPAVQLAGHAEARLDDLVEFCRAEPADVARAVRAAHEWDAQDRAAYREFAKEFDYAAVAEDYRRALIRVCKEDSSR